MNTAQNAPKLRRPALATDVYGELKPRLRGLVHAWAALPIGIAGVLLVVFTPDAGSRAAVGVYTIAVTGMLTASACYHRMRVSEHVRRYLRRLDHSMIGVAVAGTYTPVIVLTLDGALRASLLAMLWTGAVGAMLVSFLWPGVPSWLRASIYLVLGWAGVVAMPWVLSRGGTAAFVMVIVGAVLYSLGAVAYATRRPNRWPSTFGFHEVFHLLVLLAVVAHFIAVSLVVAHAA